MTLLQYLQGRFCTVSMMNDTGDVLAEGTVVYISGGEFHLTTEEGLTGKPGIAVIPEEIPNGEVGRGVFVGHAMKVNLDSAGAVDDFIKTSTTSGKATPVATMDEGIFGCLMKSGTAPEAIIWGYPNKQTTHDHNVLYYLKTELQGDGTAEVHYNNLTNVPGLSSMLIFTYSGTLQTYTGALRIRNEFGSSKTITKVHCEVKDAPAGQAIIIDIHNSATTIFTTQSNRPQIAAGQQTGESTTIEDDAWDVDDFLTMDIDQVGTTPGGYLVVEVHFE